MYNCCIQGPLHVYRLSNDTESYLTSMYCTQGFLPVSTRHPHTLAHLSQDKAKPQEDDDREDRETAWNGHPKDHTQLPLSGCKRERGEIK